MTADDLRELKQLVDGRLARLRGRGATLTMGGTGANGTAKNGTPGLINTEFAEPGIQPVAITARSIVRKVLAADILGITNAGSSVGLSVPVLAGEKWIVNVRVYCDSAAASIGGYSLTWLGLPATSFFRFAVLGVGTSASTFRRMGTAAPGALTDRKSVV